MAKTSNELFRDALLRRQIALAQYERQLQSDIMTLLDKTERDLRIELEDRLTNIAGRDFTATLNSRLNVLANAIAKIRADAFSETGDMWDSSMRDLAVAEANYLDHNLKQVMPVQLDTVLPAAESLAAIVTFTPVRGRVLSDWAETVGDVDSARIMDAVRIGVAQGEKTSSIVGRILGSSELDGSDGVLEMTRRDAASVTQTAIQTISNEARQQYFEANSDVFDEEQWVATLDDATCEECGALDGETFPVGEGEQPPLHFNCRCVRVAVIGNTSHGDRPANAATADELDGLSKDERRERIKELVGTVPASTTYSDWLGNQTQAFQDHVLGPTRGSLFRDGDLSLDRFVNRDGKMLTLDQLREVEPSAFRKAGI